MASENLVILYVAPFW